jgi:type I restriction enzyme S subunit
VSLDLLLNQFDTIADSTAGVARLRQLILELAVRGRLAEQNPSDEPASALLERARLAKIKLGGSARRNDVPPSQNLSIPLAEGWVWTNLAELGLVNPRNDVTDETYVSFVPMTFVPQVYGEPLHSEIRQWQDVKKGFTHFAEGDVALAKITPCFQNGKAAVMRGIHNGFGAGTTELHIFRPLADTVLPEYVYIYLKSPNFVNEGIPRMTGTAGQKRVPNDYFALNPFPLPPLAEQRRIIERVDQLMALCDALEERQARRGEERRRLLTSLIDALLNAGSPDESAVAWARLRDSFDLVLDTPENVAPLRQAVLQLAVQGRLVEQDPVDEPVRALLHRVRTEKARLIKAGQINKPAPLPDIETSEILSTLPVGWAWERLGNLAKFVDYRGHTPPKTDRGVRLITAKNVRMGFISDEPREYISEETYKTWMTRGFPRFGDVLFTTEAPLGNIAQLLTEEKVALAQRVIDLQPFADLFAAYLKIALLSPMLQDAIIDKSSGMTATGIKASRLKLILVPIPPLPEQRRIVERVDQLMALCDDLEAKLREERAAAERLAEALCREVAGNIHGNSVVSNGKPRVDAFEGEPRQARMMLE